ncbi:MAG TPA: hypothetical protein VJV79_34190 [Polyangiaceae bacterium]|nr:hypothetical protein [Polyangiaceae bacterium]
MSGGFTPPVGGGFGGGIKLPEVGGVFVGGGALGGRALGGGATRLPEVGGMVATPPAPPATLTPASSTLAGAPAMLGGGGATKLPEVTGSRPQAAT